MLEQPAHDARWLLLVHQLPPRPSNLRVQIWRRLQQVGAIVLRNSVYVLPLSSEAREDFEWIRTEIVGRGGQVSILSGNVVDGYTENELIDQFRRLRAADYDKLIGDMDKTARQWGQTRRRPARAAVQRELGKFRQRLHALKAIDYFAAPHGGEAESAIDRLEQSLGTGAEAAEPRRVDVREFKGRTWLTRPRPGIDRMASAWLIRRFVDPDARFAFGALPTPDGHIPFDMPDIEFGHTGSHCTYETLFRRFGVQDAAALRVGQVVHDLDLKATRYRVPEAASIGRLVDGLRDGISDDQDLLRQGIQMIDALYRSYLRDRTERAARKNKRATTGSGATARKRRRS